jgi:hypothetical protein
VTLDLEYSVGGQVRELLEDFEVVGTHLFMALIPRGERYGAFAENVRAAAVASTLRLSSLDYARRRYVEPVPNQVEVEHHHPYIDAYAAAKTHVERAIGRLRTAGRPDPTVGIFGSSLVLERLPASFFCAHFMYRMGHRYEGHAVARLILEQLAWAYAAHDSDDMAFIEAVETTRSISVLKQFVPEAGRLYGFLSNKTHIDYSTHHEFLTVEGDRNVVLHAKPDFPQFAEIMLRLADLFVLVWEVSQAPYLDTFEAIHEPNTSVALTPNLQRPFLSEIARLLEAVTLRAGHAGT